MLKNRIQTSPFGNVERVLAQAHNVPDNAEKKHSDAHVLILTDWCAGASVSIEVAIIAAPGFDGQSTRVR